MRVIKVILLIVVAIVLNLLFTVGMWFIFRPIDYTDITIIELIKIMLVCMFIWEG